MNRFVLTDLTVVTHGQRIFVDDLLRTTTDKKQKPAPDGLPDLNRNRRQLRVRFSRDDLTNLIEGSQGAVAVSDGVNPQTAALSERDVVHENDAKKGQQPKNASVIK